MMKKLKVKSLNLKVLFFIFLLSAVCCLLSTVVDAKVYIDINSPSFKKLPVAVTDFTYLGNTRDPDGQGKKIAEVIRKDLDFSGFFDLLDPASFIEDPKRAGITEDKTDFKDWSTIGAEALVKGAISIEGQKITIEARLFDVFLGRMLVGKKYTGEIKDARKIAHKFSNEIVKSFTGEEGIFDTSIAFIVNGGSAKELYIMDYDGNNVRKITNSGTLNLSPSWSPDNTRIVFSTERGRSWWIYSIDVNSKEEKRIINQWGLNMGPSFSPDGGKIAYSYSRDGNSDIYIINGSSAKRITNNPAIDISPAWSPSGKQIAFVSDRAGSPQIYIMDSNGENVQRITFEGNYNVSPSWSPRGEKIAFASRRNGKFQVCLVNPDGSGLQQLTNEGNNENPSWSPDGRYIVFSSTRNGKNGIFTMKASGDTQRSITPKDMNAANPAWSFRPK